MAMGATTTAVISRIAATISRVAMGVCACALAVGLTGCALTTPSRAEVEHETIEPTLSAADLVEDGYLTVAMDTTDAPQALTDANGEPSGYYGDLARAFAQRTGLKVKVVSAGSAAASVSEGKADIFIGAQASDAADGLTVFGSVVENGSALYAKTADGSNEVPTVSATALSGATVAVQDASASQDALNRAGIDASQTVFENVNQCFEALDAGEVQYVACDATAGSYLARAYQGVVFVGTISSVSSYGIAAPADSAVASEIASVYEEMLDDGTIDAIHTIWYGGMSLSLSDTLLSGVTLSSESATNDDAENTANGEAEGEDGGQAIGESINSIG